MGATEEFLKRSSLSTFKEIETNFSVLDQLTIEQNNNLKGIKASSNILKTGKNNHKSNIFNIISAKETNLILGSPEGAKETQQKIYKEIVKSLANTTRDYHLPRVLISSCDETKTDLEILQKNINESGKTLAALQSFLANDPSQGNIVNKAENSYSLSAKNISFLSNSTLFVNTPALNIATNNLVEQFFSKHLHGDLYTESLTSKFSTIEGADVKAAKSIFVKADQCIEEFSNKHYIQAEKTVDIKAKDSITFSTKTLILQGVNEFKVDGGGNNVFGNISFSNGSSALSLQPGLIDFKAGCLNLSSDCQAHIKTAGEAILSGGKKASLMSFGPVKVEGASLDLSALPGPSGDGSIKLTSGLDVTLAALGKISIAGIVETKISSGAKVSVKASAIDIASSAITSTSLGPHVITGFPVFINCGASSASTATGFNDIAASTAETTAIITAKTAEFAVNLAKATALLAASTTASTELKVKSTLNNSQTQAIEKLQELDFQNILAKTKAAAKIIQKTSNKIIGDDVTEVNDLIKAINTSEQEFNNAKNTVKTVINSLKTLEITTGSVLKTVDSLRVTTDIFLPNLASQNYIAATQAITDTLKQIDNVQKELDDKLNEFNGYLNISKDIEKKASEVFKVYNLVSQFFNGRQEVTKVTSGELNEAQKNLNKTNSSPNSTEKEKACAEFIQKVALEINTRAMLNENKYKENNIDPLNQTLQFIETERNNINKTISTAKNTIKTAQNTVKNYAKELLDLIDLFNSILSLFTFNPVPVVDNNYIFRKTENLFDNSEPLSKLKMPTASTSLVTDSKDYLSSTSSGVNK